MRSGAGTTGPARLTRDAVARAQDGDPEGIHYLYVRYADDVRRYVASFVRDHHEAEDITQNVFAKLITAIERYQERDVPFEAWILRVARNAALDHLRARRAVPTEEVRIAALDSAEERLGSSQALRQALDELPEEQRRVLVLRHVVGLSPVEIADALDKTESAVHGLHHRGRRALRANLAAMGVTPVVAREPAP